MVHAMNMRRNLSRPLHGFTLVELLVVIAIIGILVALLLPAVQAARESARKTHCLNNLKQMALGFQNHHSAHGFFPSGGWGYNWVGDADRGFGKRQPGGWMYQILPYIEEQALFDLGRGISPWNAEAKKTAHTQRNQAPRSVFLCPTRARPSMLDPWIGGFAYNCNHAEFAAFDYCANTGDDGYAAHRSPGGPKSLEEGDNSSNWKQITEGGSAHLPAQNWTGIVFQRSEIAIKNVTDGSSATYMLGENYLGTDFYINTPQFFGNSRGPFWGFSTASQNWTGEFDTPLQDRPGFYSKYRFGSAHPSGFHMAFCDGSVRSIGYEIDGAVHRQLGVRNDGLVVDQTAY